MAGKGVKKKIEKPQVVAAADSPLIIKTENTPVKNLNTYYKNPRVGNVNVIADSLSQHGQYRAIVVNMGTMTGRPNEVLAGNHTLLGARKLGWEKIMASFVDVDDKTAAKIVLVDNKSAEEGTYDEEVLAELFKSLDDLAGTAWSEDEVEDIVSQFGDLDDSELDGLGDIDDGDLPERSEPRKPKFTDVPLGDEEEAEEEEPTPRQRAKAKEEGTDIEKASDTLTGAFQLDDEMFFIKGSKGKYNMPALREDMLVQPEDIPEKLTAWAGSATKGGQDEDPDIWYLYNWGVDSTSGMSNVSQVIPSFYCYDYYFERWWDTPSKYVAKVLNSGITMIVTPDFSDEPQHGFAFNLWQQFRNRWLARFFQEAGLKIIPNINWPDGDIDMLRDVVLGTMPKHVPVIIMQMQTLNPDEVVGGLDNFAKQVQLIVDTLKPKVFIVYSGKPGKKFMDEKINLKKTGTELLWLTNRQSKLAEKAKGREKKKTI